MKWTKEHDVLLGKEVMLFELWKYKLGSRETGNCLYRIAESLNQLQEPFFNMSQKSIRDRLKILERDLKRKDRFERNASGISPEKSEIDVIMEDYLERKEEQERESEKISDKTAKDKASAEEMRNKAMERLGETKKRAGDDQPRKKRKHTPNETMDYLREATEKECELKKEELEFRKKQEERALAQQNLMFQQQQEMSRQFQDQLKNQQQQFQMMCQMFMQQQQQQSQALLELLKKGIESIFCCFYYTYKARFSLCRLNLTCLPSNEYYKNCASLLLIMRRFFFTISTGIFTQPSVFINAS